LHEVATQSPEGPLYPSYSHSENALAKEQWVGTLEFVVNCNRSP